jgi:hypothetical protein
LTICWRPQENPYAAPIARPAPVPSFSAAALLTGITDTAASSACATSRVTGVGNSRKNGAINATIGWKWSPSRLKPGPLMSTIGACRWAYCLTYSVKMPRSHDVGSKRRYRNTEIGTYAANTASAISQGTRSARAASVGGAASWPWSAGAPEACWPAAPFVAACGPEPSSFSSRRIVTATS